MVTPARLHLIIRIRRRIQLRIADGFDLAFQVEGFVQDGVDGLHGQDGGQPQAREDHGKAADGPQQQDDAPVDKLPHYAQRGAGQVAQKQEQRVFDQPRKRQVQQHDLGKQELAASSAPGTTPAETS